MMTFMSCHLLGMSSTCTNPALYGYLNQNIQLEIIRSAKDLKGWLGWETIRIVGNTVKIQTRAPQHKVYRFLELLRQSKTYKIVILFRMNKLRVVSIICTCILKLICSAHKLFCKPNTSHPLFYDLIYYNSHNVIKGTKLLTLKTLLQMSFVLRTFSSNSSETEV